MTLYRTLLTLSFFILLSLLFGVPSGAAPNDWAEGTKAASDGATREYYNSAGLLKWKNYMGDWVDKAGKAQGDQAYAKTVVKDDDTVKPVRWDVTTLVREWVAHTHQNQGMFVRTTSGTWSFASREHTTKAYRPLLLLYTTRGNLAISPVADTYLEKSTYRSMGDQVELKLPLLVRFNLSFLKKSTVVTKAILQLTTLHQYGKTAQLGVFRSKQGHSLPPSKPIAGLAAKYTNDVGIEKDPNVVLFSNFENADWKARWTHVGGVYGPVKSDQQRNFSPLLGKALGTTIKKGKHIALQMFYGFDKALGKDNEPEEIFFRYYLRLANDWDQTVQSGKMPGFGGTYDRAGWGGRKSDGYNGWSARGLFMKTIREGNPLAGRTPLGHYVYHADMAGKYGDIWIWQNDYRGFLYKNRWYAIEQYLKMNTPGKKDGVLRAWVDGQLAFEKKDVLYRHDDKLKIQRIWFNLYHGGRTASPYDQRIYIDNIVIAHKYIGPLSSRLSLKE